MSVLTCISCHVAFSTSSMHREHYKSDWHRYNLMRKVAELPPITFEIFEQRAAIQKQKLELKQSESEIRSYCKSCRKYFGTENALSNHLQSKKHLEMIEKEKKKPPSKPQIYPAKKSSELGAIQHEKDPKSSSEEVPEELMEEDEDSDWESVDGDIDEDSSSAYNLNGEPLEENHCLFCSFPNANLESNLEHMTSSHSFFIPDLEYLTDISGLVTYLGQKVGAGRVCLWCSTPGGRRFRSVHAVQQHMLDKGHCKIKHEGHALLEYTNYYNYSKSYPEVDTAVVDDDDDDEDEVDLPQLDGDDWQLVLPSGATIGHRSLKIYFKQNVRPTRLDRKEGKTHYMLHNLMHKYRALGWTGTSSSQEAAVRRARDMRYIGQLQAKQYMRLGSKANKFQPHFRPQVIF